MRHVEELIYRAHLDNVDSGPMQPASREIVQEVVHEALCMPKLDERQHKLIRRLERKAAGKSTQTGRALDLILALTFALTSPSSCPGKGAPLGSKELVSLRYLAVRNTAVLNPNPEPPTLVTSPTCGVALYPR